MGHRTGRLPLLVLALVVALTFSGGMRGADRGAARAIPRFSASEVARLLVYPSGRAHPEGPEADELTTVRRASYPAAGSSTWRGAGRHAMWRGCRHTFDPSLSKFIFSSGSST
jgi:hypothetical protein